MYISKFVAHEHFMGMIYNRHTIYHKTFCSETLYIYMVKVEKYVGSTTDFKDRLGNHEKSFKHERYKHETVLSSHIWECKERGSTYTVTWKALDRGQPFNPVTKTCKLCTREKFYIIRKPHQATLNHRQEIGAHCRHIAMSLISKVEKVKVGWGRDDQDSFVVLWLTSCLESPDDCGSQLPYETDL